MTNGQAGRASGSLFNVAQSRKPPTPLDCAYCNALLLDRWSVRQKLNHVSLIQFSYRVFTRSSKRPALACVFWIHLPEVCWTFAGSCKHPITSLCTRFKNQQPCSK